MFETKFFAFYQTV